MTNYEPCRDFMLVVPTVIDEVSKGGIIIPDQARRNMNEGTVTKIGPDVQSIKVGDKVVFAEASEYKLKVDGNLLLLVSEPNVLLTCKAANTNHEEDSDRWQAPPVACTIGHTGVHDAQ